MTEERNPTFEENLGRLEQIVAALERGEAPLEKGLELFEEGVRLTRSCHEMLAVAEERVNRLVRSREGEEPRLELFPEEGGGA